MQNSVQSEDRTPCESREAWGAGQRGSEAGAGSGEAGTALFGQPSQLAKCAGRIGLRCAAICIIVTIDQFSDTYYINLIP